MLKLLTNLIVRVGDFFNAIAIATPDVVNTCEIITIFDGDNVSKYGPATTKYVAESNSHDRHVWVTVSTIPKSIQSNDRIEKIRPVNIAKEAADMHIAMMSVYECSTNKNIKELRIVSSDGDMVQTMVSLAEMFPSVKFSHLIPPNSQTSDRAKDAIRLNEISNVNFDKFNIN